MLAQTDIGTWLIDQAPAIVITVAVAWMLATGRIRSEKSWNEREAMWKERFDHERDEKEQWREIALTSIKTQEEGVEVVQKLAESSPEVRRDVRRR